jgi:D-alanine-D-alanine ligase
MDEIYKNYVLSEIETDNIDQLKRFKIAVLCGGRSPEREVSLSSGKNVFQALIKKGYQAEIYDLDKRFYRDAIDRKFDVVFIVLHGSPGEDGSVQGFLELLGIPYVGSGIAASAVGMDKLLTKAVLAANGLPIARFESFCFRGRHGLRIQSQSLLKEEPKEGQFDSSLFSVYLPVVVKPARLGSSVGVSIAKDLLELEKAVQMALSHDCCVIIEEYLKAREIQFGIVGRKKPLALPSIEIKPKNEFFDYEAKYTPGAAEEISPAPISEELEFKGRELALAAFKALGCRDFARVDMFLLENGEFVVSEINTIPGMTSNSLVPKEAAALGLSYENLIEMIVLPALAEALRKETPDL